MTDFPRLAALALLPALAVTNPLPPLAAADPLPAFTSRGASGPDFSVQGEYTGLVGGQYRIGIQIVALGAGRFEGILFGGGLPGAGWDGKTRFYLRGQREKHITHLEGMHGERLKFVNRNFQATIRDGQLEGTAMMFLNRVRDPAVSCRRILRTSPTLGAAAPPKARVLFAGDSTDEWRGGRLVEKRLLAEGTRSRRSFLNYHLHLEFRTPFMPTARGMQRGNSGVYLQELWELQVIDSFGWTTENRKYERLSHVGRCGGLHELLSPEVHMCLPPLSWQTYDIDHTAATVDSNGRPATPALLSVRHNGVLIHDRVVLPPTPASSRDLPHRNHLPGRLHLQQHGNPVRYRNIWIVER